VSVAVLVQTTPLKHTVGSCGSDEGEGNQLEQVGALVDLLVSAEVKVSESVVASDM
jgi:hypothetical protein